MRTFIDARGYKTKIMAASFKNSQQVIDSLESGAHTATIPPDVLNNMMNKDLALQALQVFEADGQALLAAYGE
jgi:transaldolase